MAGTFELFTDGELSIRFRLLAADGTFLAVSGPFVDKRSAALGIAFVRECAGTGLINDVCSGSNESLEREI
ncbi:YegP family protein [Arthrobacter sp. H20]|uniref:YegP family protein n=1 Tax=Arthrobacter sp. H20 TaxID=1267981 RepID=UPI0004B3ABB8|nr:YegP family protein [Arthrobacter sp. H20]